MGNNIIVKRGKYTFYLYPKTIYFKINNPLNQKFRIIKRDGTTIGGQCHLALLDAIYEHKIVDTSGLSEYILNEYSLEPTTKSL